MADIKLNYISNGADQIKKDFEIIKKETKAIKDNPVKVTMRSQGVQEAIDAFGRLRVEIPKLEQVYNSLQNKNSNVAKNMLKDIKNLKGAFEELNSLIGKQGKVSSGVYDNFKNAGALDATVNAEKRITEELSKQQKIREGQEKELLRLKNELQGISRQLSDQQNAILTGKKGKTPYDIGYLSKQFDMLTAQANELVNALGEDNQAVQNFKNGMDWTEANNPLRALRDEAYKIIPDIVRLEQEITKLKSSGENGNLLAFDEKRLAELKGILEMITTELGNASKTLSEDKGYAEYVKQLEQSVHLMEQQEQKLQSVKTARQEAMNLDTQQHNAEKQYLNLLKEKFDVEKKIEQLSKDSKSSAQNQKVISDLKQQVVTMERKLAVIREEYNVESTIPEKINAATQAHKNEMAAIQAKNESLNDTGRLISDTLKNFVKFTIYYTSLSYLKQGLREAISTMKELDAAFTDIRLVTGGTAEETNQLAKEYNALAKEMGATTVEVANGAGEWLRQGKTAEETAQLLKASMTLSKVGAIESSEATQLLTSSLNGYKLEAQDAMSVVDKISAIDLAAATSSEELAVALARTANIADDSQVSFDKLLAMIGTVSSVTRRSAETIRRII